MLLRSEKFFMRAVQISLVGVAFQAMASSATGGSQPFLGQPFLISPTAATRIEAENYDNGGQGVAYHDTSPENWGKCYRPDEQVDLKRIIREPGKFAVMVESGEWMNYSIKVVQAGKYRLSMRTSRPPNELPGLIRIKFNGGSLDCVVHGQGGYNRFQEANYDTVSLSAGEQVLQIESLSNGGGLDWVQLEPVDAPAEMVSTTVPSMVP